jgi:hypothetical protein
VASRTLASAESHNASTLRSYRALSASRPPTRVAAAIQPAAIHHASRCVSSINAPVPSTWFDDCYSGIVFGSLQEPLRDPRGADRIRCPMPRPDDAPRCVSSRVCRLPSCGRGRSATRGRNRHAVLGIRRCVRTPPFRPACMHTAARALRLCVPARAVQGHMHSSARTRAAQCSRPTPRSTARRAQRAAQRGCGTVKRTAVRAWTQQARVSPGRRRLYPCISTSIWRERD